MIKRTYISAIILSFIISCESEDLQKNDLQKLNIKGKVKELSQDIYTVRGGADSITIGEKIRNRWDLNEIDIFSNTYNSFGNILISSTLDQSNSNYIIENKYDSDNNLISSNTYESPNKKLTKKLLFNYSQNKLSEEKYFSASGQLEYITKYIYDTFGNNTIQEFQNEYGTKTASKINEFDINHNLISYISYSYPESSYGDCEDPTGCEAAKANYKYDKNNNMIEESGYGIDDSTTDIYTYDENDLLVETQKISKMNGIIIHKHKYEFDKNGNWIKRIDLDQNSIPLWIITRNISYF